MEENVIYQFVVKVNHTTSTMHLYPDKIKIELQYFAFGSKYFLSIVHAIINYRHVRHAQKLSIKR